MSARIDAAAFERIYDGVSNWGRWGADDQRGTLNHITSECVASAANLVSRGITVSLAHDLDTMAGPDNGRPALHYMTQLSDVGDGEPRVNTDFVGTDFHGKSVTHIDALCHCNYRGRLYNDRQPGEHVDTTGSAFGSVAQMSAGIVSRGMLVDVPRARGVEWLEPGTAITADDLDQVLAAQGVRPSRGDIVLVRTGHRRRRIALGAWDPTNSSAGLHPSAMAWLHRNKAAVLGSDGDSDSRPSPVDDVHSPIHALALAGMGMPLIDNTNLEDVADTCFGLGRWEFLLVLAPLRIPGGTGSPVNPVAVF